MKHAGIGLAVLVTMMILAPLLLARVSSRRRPRLGLDAGAVTLRMPRGHWAVLGGLAALPCAAVSALAFLADWGHGAEANGPLLGGFMALVGAAGGGLLLLLELRGRLELDQAGMRRVGPLGELRAAWSDVARLTYNPRNDWFFLTLQNGRRVYVTTGLDGCADFAGLALQKLPAAVLEASPEAVEELRELDRVYR